MEQTKVIDNCGWVANDGHTVGRDTCKSSKEGRSAGWVIDDAICPRSLSGRLLGVSLLGPRARDADGLAIAVEEETEWGDAREGRGRERSRDTAKSGMT